MIMIINYCKVLTLTGHVLFVYSKIASRKDLIGLWMSPTDDTKHDYTIVGDCCNNRPSNLVLIY